MSGCSAYFSWTSVPPVNSIPRFRPCTITTMTESTQSVAERTSHDRLSFMKSILVSWRMRNTGPLSDAQCLDARLARQDQLEQLPRDEDRGEHGHGEPQDQRDGEAAHGTRAVHTEENRRGHRRDVAVE